MFNYFIGLIKNLVTVSPVVAETVVNDTKEKIKSALWKGLIASILTGVVIFLVIRWFKRR